jgi:hypothetical protein
MFLFKLLFWLIALPFRLVFFVVGLALWVLTLPLRIVFSILGLFGIGRILQLGVIANDHPADSFNTVASQPTTTSELKSAPST